ncbi:UNVERIFIED_ORG: hypothetical protein BCL66_1064 [Martelella mediterranea]
MERENIVYILDPVAARLLVVDLPQIDMKAIKDVLGYAAIDTLRLPSGHLIYFHDNGLQQGVTHYITIAGQPDPLVGRLLVVALADDDEGTFMSSQQAHAMMSLFRPVMDPIITSLRATCARQTTFVSAVEGFQTRIEKVEIKIVSQQASNAMVLN